MALIYEEYSKARGSFRLLILDVIKNGNEQRQQKLWTESPDDRQQWMLPKGARPIVGLDGYVDLETRGSY